MSISVRAATDADWATMQFLDGVAFGVVAEGSVKALWRASMPAGQMVLAEEDGQAVGEAGYLSMDVTVPGGASLPACGISYVSVLPTHRRRGILRKMFTPLHEMITATGAPIAMLTASDAAIYPRFGYGPAITGRTVSVDRRFAQFHSSAPDIGGVRFAQAEFARRELPVSYDRWRAVTPGAQSRSAAEWDFIFTDEESLRQGMSPRYYVVHPDGYAIYRANDFFTGANPPEAVVSEFRAATPEAAAALWRALCGLDLSATVTVRDAADESIRLLLTDYRLPKASGFHDVLWVRIMKVAEALSARTYLADVAVTLDVRDPFLDAGGAFRLIARDGVGECARTDQPADVSLDLDVLGAVYLGAHTFTEYAQAGRIAGDPALLRALDAAFASERPAQLGWAF
jgi:predicted acetyltransferase